MQIDLLDLIKEELEKREDIYRVVRCTGTKQDFLSVYDKDMILLGIVHVG